MDSAIEGRSIEVRYAGVVVGRATQAKNWTSSGAFIGFAEPLPTGTRIELHGEEVRPARVEEVFESADPAICGMKISFLSPSALASPSAASPSPTPPAAAETGPAPGAGGGGGKRRRRR